MKVLWLFIVVAFIPGCHETATPNKNKVPSPIIVAIQPLGDVAKPTLQFLSSEIQNFYLARVIVLPARQLPHRFFNNTKSPRYCADSLLQYLQEEVRDSIDYVIGMTAQDIFTTKKDEDGHAKEPAEKYKIWGIMGLAYTPGKSSLVSDFRLRSLNKELEKRRLRNVALHELGHNFGLPHCAHQFCIMTDANESITTIDKESNGLCPSCRQKLKEALIIPK
jgi:archaemetzincin